jgi:hypothetical protein
MNGRVWKVAASLAFVATVIGVVGILQNGDQTAYAFEQTIAAMRGKRFYHIQTYYASPTQRHDEFWAEFDEQGQVTRVRQTDQWKREDWPVEVLWENQVEYKYRPNYWSGTLTIRKATQHVDKVRLEEFDPQMMVEYAFKNVEQGRAIVDVHDSLTEDGHLLVEVNGGQPYGERQVLLVDPETKLVRRMDLYDDEPDEEGNYRYRKGIKVLEYDHSSDPGLFDPDEFVAGLPPDTVIIDQVSRPVGMVQGDLSDEEVAVEVARQALEALAADDYETAGLLFGGAPKEYFERRPFLKPLADIVVGEPRFRDWHGPTFEIDCSYQAQRDDGPTTINLELWIWRTTEEEQPARWFINPAFISREEGED